MPSGLCARGWCFTAATAPHQDGMRNLVGEGSEVRRGSLSRCHFHGDAVGPNKTSIGGQTKGEVAA